MREPDIRCDWTPERGCRDQAAVIVTYPSGWRRPMCHTHAEIILHGRYDGGQRATEKSLIRDPRPIALMLLGLHGSLDAPLRRLIAEHIATPATGAGAVAIDLAEERGYHEGPLPVVEREWPRIELHEHVWLPVRAKNSHEVFELDGSPRRQCTCGVYEFGDLVLGDHQPCSDRHCQRERGHDGPHMSRSWNAQDGLEEIEEWGDGPLDAALAEQRELLAMLHDEPNLREDERPPTE